ncbi:MAG: NfeD family protein, partial [bacterium]|nr:NfeD family protein [bacterium]
IRDKYLSMAIVANDVELWWVRNTETGIEVAIDRREFLLLFPGQDPAGDTRLARIPGRDAKQEPLVDPSGNPTSAPGDPSGSQKLAGVASDLVQKAVIADLSMRPTFTAADAGKWTVITKILDGTAPATFSAKDLQFFNFASNPTVSTGVGTAVSIAPIRTDEDIRILMGASNIRRLDKSWSEGLVAFLTSTWVRGLLIACLLVCIFVELTHPGVILPGVVAVIAFMLLVLPAWLIGMANWWEVGAMAVGIALLALELLVIPGFGFAGIAGALLLFVGLVGTFIPAGQGVFPDSPRQQNDLLRGMVVTLVATVTAILGIWLIFRNLKSLPVLNRFVLRDPMDDAEDLSVMMGLGDDAPAVKVGVVGVTQTALRPVGRVLFGDQLIDVVAEIGYVPAGAKVRVVSATGSRIGVEPLRDGQQST